MIELQWEILEHTRLSTEDEKGIVLLKNQHWPYGVESQIEWIVRNIRAGDYHLMGKDSNGIIRAYLAMSQLHVCFDNRNYINALGVGGVCVDKTIEHSGYGMLLLQEASVFIKNLRTTGLLLCKDELLSFYMKCNWIIVDYIDAYVADMKYKLNIMSYPNMVETNTIIINRNF